MSYMGIGLAGACGCIRAVRREQLNKWLAAILASIPILAFRRRDSNQFSRHSTPGPLRRVRARRNQGKVLDHSVRCAARLRYAAESSAHNCTCRGVTSSESFPSTLCVWTMSEPLEAGFRSSACPRPPLRDATNRNHSGLPCVQDRYSLLGSTVCSAGLTRERRESGRPAPQRQGAFGCWLSPAAGTFAPVARLRNTEKPTLPTRLEGLFQSYLPPRGPSFRSAQNCLLGPPSI